MDDRCSCHRISPELGITSETSTHSILYALICASSSPVAHDDNPFSEMGSEATVGDGFNFVQLKSAILGLSRAQNWEAAKSEWRLIDVSEADEAETCLCGHHPIFELCSIKNGVTGSVTTVGNVCVKRFLGLRSDLVFASIKRIRTDLEKGINAQAASLFFQSGILNQWEYDFCQDTSRKRNLTDKQLVKRISINRKILGAISRTAMNSI